jgi:murein DD-endopeptidase MepM/ murein hydrolase activator NlpD
MTDPTHQRPLSRRQLLAGLAAGAGLGALAMSRLGSSLVAADEPELAALDGAGTALARAERLRPPIPTGRPRPGVVWPNGVDAGLIPEPPPGKLIFPLLPGDSCGFHDDSYYHSRGSRTHLAVDIMSTAERPVFAVCDGQLTTRYSNTGTAGWGWTIDDASSNRRYKYFHCIEYANGFELGDTVRTGDVIGFVGSSGTGSATNFHLHFEVWEGTSRRLDPYPLLDVPASCDVW